MLSMLQDWAVLAQASDWWTNQFFGLDQEKRFVILILLIVFGTAIIISTVGIVTGVISSVSRRRLEADIKRDMLDRGMSAEEIARVVESAPPESFLDRWAANQGKKKTG